MRCIAGTHHQGNALIFGNNAGYQCTAVALAALIFASLVSVSEWSSANIDQILMYGDALYTSVIQSHYQGNTVYLMPSDLPDMAHYMGIGLQIDYAIDVIHGINQQNGDTNVDENFLAVSLQEGLQSGFFMSDFVLLTLSEITVAVIHDPLQGTYSVFDSHSRDVLGNPVSEGTAVMLIFADLEDMCLYFSRTFANILFNITPVTLRQLENPINKTQDLIKNHSITTFNHTYSKDSFPQAADFTRLETEMSLHKAYNHTYCRSVTSVPTYKSYNRSLLYDHTYCSCETNEHAFLPTNRHTQHGNEDGYMQNRTCQRYIDESLCLQNINNLSDDYNFLNTSSSLRHTEVCVVEQTNAVNNCEVVTRNELKVASNITLCVDKSHPFVRAIQQYPSYNCKSCQCFLYLKNSLQCDINNNQTALAAVSQGDYLCRKCYSQFKKGDIPKESFTCNKFDAGKVPNELKDLFVVEKRLISFLPVFLTLIILPGGQLAQEGVAINIPVNVSQQLSSLMNMGTRSCGASLLISCERPNKDPVTLPVRRLVLFKALLWLKMNNHLYKDLNISSLESPGLASHSSFLSDYMQDPIEEEFGLTEKDSLPYKEHGTEPNVSNLGTLPIVTGKPVCVKDLAFGEEKAFPWLFPYGLNGIGTTRNTYLTDLAYFHIRLYMRDYRWRCDIPYVMSSLNQHEWNVLTSLVSTYMRTKRPCHDTGNYLPVTAEDIDNIQNDPVLMQNSYMFTKDIRGTAAYWKSVLLRLLAMVKTLGAPTFFVTLSANDNWPEVKNMLKLHKPTHLKHQVKDDPLMAALAFQNRWAALMKHVLKKEMPLGKVHDFFSRVEFQCRGSCHIHMFIWTSFGIDFENAPAAEIIDILNRTISTQLPDENTDQHMHQLVKLVQVHKHSFTCKKGNRVCRFDYPRHPCPKTKICFSVDTIAHHRGRFYETCRGAGDTWVNAYNPTILRYWRANMDIQLVGNAQSCAFYVCKYICKAEPEELKETLSALFQNSNFHSLDLRKRLIRIGTCILKKRKLSAQEAMYRLGGLKLYESSRQVISINTLLPHKRFKLVKPKAQRVHLAPSCTDERELFESNIIDFYRSRPSELALISLHAFASWYTRDNNIIKSHALLPRHRLLPPYSQIVFRRRRDCVIVKPSQVKQASDNYYYSCLLLYFPHRTELELLIPYKSYKQSFVARYSSFDCSYKKISSLSSELEDAIRRIRLLQDQLHFSDEQLEHDTGIHDHNDCEDYSVLGAVSDEELVQTVPCSLSADPQSDYDNDTMWHTLNVCSVSENTLENRISVLSPDQKKVLFSVQTHFKHRNHSKSLYMFCSGGAGTGKSFLLQTVVEWLRLCYPVQPGHDSVIVAAPTGIAARNVMGYTLHSIFKLPVQHGYEPDFHELPAYALKKLREMFQNIHTIVIDEISMVSSKYFHYIHQRLCSIANNDKPFGGFNMILFGDFYQLRPVRGRYVFTDNILWPLFEPYVLRTNKRQEGNLTFINLLNRVRIGEPSPEDITLLQTRLVACAPLTEHLLHIFPTNKQVKIHNQYEQSLINGKLYTFEAEHVFSHYDVHPGHEVPSELLPEDDRYAGGLPKQLCISVGTRVMLLRNLLTKQGLVNGAMGVVVHIQEATQELAAQVFVRFDNSSIGQTFQSHLHQNSIPITRYTQEYLYLGRYVNRIQFPLTPCWACTVHKLQGISVDSAVISLGPEIFQAGQAYVALSRVRSLNGLYLLALCAQRIYANVTVIDEYARILRQLQNNI